MRKIVEFFRNNRKWNMALWGAIMVFLVFSILAINTREDSMRIRRIEVNIEPREELAFLDSQKIMDIIKRGDTSRILISARRNDINIDVMEADLEANPFIEKADVSTDLSGKLIIRVLQRNPVLRIVNAQGQ
jgi:cell division protein FtsQ